MKLLANIFLSGLAILACVSCSKDEDPVLSLEGAKLSVAVKASGTATKAYNPNDVNELEGEAYINNLAVVVFNETGTELLGYKWEALSGAEHSAIIADVPTTKAVRARIIVLANVPRDLLSTISTYDEFQTRLVDLSSQSQTNLTMSSQVIVTKSALSEEDNYLGYTDLGDQNVDGISDPILLTRVAARIDLVNISTRFAGTPFAGREVRIDAVGIYNMKTKSYYFSEADWGETEAPDAVRNSEDTSFEDLLVNDGTSISNTPFVHYVMENMKSDDHTMIAVKATLQGNSSYQDHTKIFTAVINIGSIAGDAAYPGGSVYCATKAAVKALSDGLRIDLVDTPLRVTNIKPGMVETNFSVVRYRGDKQAADNFYKGIRPLTGEDVAETVYFAASAPEHIQIAEVLLMPTNQATGTISYKKKSE